jgi:hypothetical protein
VPTALAMVVMVGTLALCPPYATAVGRISVSVIRQLRAQDGALRLSPNAPYAWIARHDMALPRRNLRPDHVETFVPQKTEGAGNAGCFSHTHSPMYE